MNPICDMEFTDILGYISKFIISKCIKNVSPTRFLYNQFHSREQLVCNVLGDMPIRRAHNVTIQCLLPAVVIEMLKRTEALAKQIAHLVLLQYLSMLHATWWAPTAADNEMRSVESRIIFR